MSNPFDDPDAEFFVLVNHQGQYSLWPAFRNPPAGWTLAGPRGARLDCVNWIEAQWTDMLPPAPTSRSNAA